MSTTQESTITLTVNGQSVSVVPGTTILQACRSAGINLPTLCHLEGVCSNASCGICVVEVDGARSLVRSCVQAAREGMNLVTSNARIVSARRTIIELLLANHPNDCLSCIRSGCCELQDMAVQMGVKSRRFPRTKKPGSTDFAGWGVMRDNDKCILCGRCVAVCRDMQSVFAIDFAGRGIRTRIAPYLDRPLSESTCVSCGQCTVVCPTSALTERDESDAVFDVLYDRSLTVVVQTAPAIRATLGEALGMPPGSLVTGKMASALRRLGFDYVFDTQFTADLTIMEEGSELIQRLQGGGVLPMMTSCSPGWIAFVETFYPELLPHLSTCKSPQQMFGALAKTYWADKLGLDPTKVVVVSVMPCTAKKYEAKRPEMRDAWQWWKRKGRQDAPFFDVDFAITTRELARMIHQAGVDFRSLPEEGFDNPLGQSSGAATIFGATGGVMEAAVRTAYEVVTGSPLACLELKAVRGFDGIRSATLNLAGTELKVAVAHTLRNARQLLDEIAAGKSEYAFIEVMTCPGGCLGGGGQPVAPTWEKREERRQAIYKEDRHLPWRKSHENPAVQQLYADFLGEPLGSLSHHLLHTSYSSRTP